jgi:tetratricopeptide (TPR) repeat protein
MKRSDIEDIIHRAAAAFNGRQPDEARRLCEAGLALAPNEPMLHHLLAAILFAAGNRTKAGDHIAISLRAQPDHRPARLLAARIARDDGDFQRALSHIDHAMKNGVTPVLLLEKARLLDRIGSAGQRHQAWRAVLARDPQNSEAMARLGRVLWEEKISAEAERLLTRAVDGDAPAAAWFDLGLARQDQGNHAGAAAAYRKVLDAKPDHAEAAVNLGTALQEMGDVDGAIACYALGYRSNPLTFGMIAMALTSAPHGRLWLDEDALRELLDSRAATPGAELLAINAGARHDVGDDLPI